MLRRSIYTLFIFLNLVSFLYVVTANAETTVISDVDDTFKIMNVPNKPDAIRRAFLHEAFTGMRSLYHGFESSPIFVSGTAEVFRPIMNAFMKKQGFKDSIPFLKPSIFESTQLYKERIITQVIQENTSTVILMGDNTEHDPDVYHSVMQRWPEKISSIYIRQITEKTVPTGQKLITTSLEIALSEWQAGRLDASHLESVLRDFEIERNVKTIFPEFGICPREQEWSQPYPENLEKRLRFIKERLEAYCHKKLLLLSHHQPVSHRSNSQVSQPVQTFLPLHN